MGMNLCRRLHIRNNLAFKQRTQIFRMRSNTYSSRPSWPAKVENLTGNFLDMEKNSLYFLSTIHAFISVSERESTDASMHAVSKPSGDEHVSNEWRNALPTRRSSTSDPRPDDAKAKFRHEER